MEEENNGESSLSLLSRRVIQTVKIEENSCNPLKIIRICIILFNV
jgi:hypothetical protein